ncbi:hypothetical protein D9757_011935 [Collybiopsis confluens]|uniref:Uncharacterized protein n=1 Tax=Collybiopsis confluens TaxID=2823264 RepID=A0A8H5GKS1_9AGAR|nr:hypothetical protein D9757_011935 [Collybiopsis confluens]
MLYHENFPKDPIRIKLLVIFLLALLTTRSVIDIYDVLTTFGTLFLDAAAIDKANRKGIIFPLFTAITSFSVQVFYAHRMILFSKSNYIKAIASIVVLLAFFGAITPIIAGVKSPLAANLFNDSLKYQQLKRTARKSSDPGLRLKKVERLTSKIIRQLVETGFVTAAFAIADLSHLSESTGDLKDATLSWNVVPGRLDGSTISHSTNEDIDDIAQPTDMKELNQPFSSV